MNYLAVDVGGTSTRAAVVVEDGSIVGYGRAGSGNPTSSGGTKALSSIVEAARAAMAQAGDAADDLASGVVGIAGAGAVATDTWLRAELTQAGLPDRLTLEADLLAAFCSGTLAHDGYALVAGTGAGAVRVRGSRLEATCDAIGWLLGDAGSGFWIGHRGVLAATGALDRRQPQTVLVEMVLSQLGIEPVVDTGPNGRATALDQVVENVYRLRPVELARFAPLVFEAADRGDAVAEQIVSDAAAALTVTLGAVLAPGFNGPLVLSGSILSQQPGVAQQVAESFRAVDEVSSIVTVTDGLAGSAVLALRRGGVAVDERVFERVQGSLAALRS